MGRLALFAIVLCAVACGSGGGSPSLASSDGGPVIEIPSDGGDAGPVSDAGPADAGPPDAGPAGGGDWPQYRGGARGASENPGTFAASEVANLAPLWAAP